MKKKICIFYNPKAGKKDSQETIEQIARELGQEVEVESYDVLATQDLPSLVREKAKTADMLGIAGGDGTLRHFLSALVDFKEKPIKLLILATGTGNDFIRNFDLPSLDPVERVRKMLKKMDFDSKQADVQKLYLGKCNEEIFASVSSVGVDADITQNSNRSGKSKTALSYITSTISTCITYKAQYYNIRYQNGGEEKEIKGKFYLIAVGNTRYYGRGMKVVPNANPRDSKLGICLVEDIGFVRLLYRFPKIFKGTHIELPYVHNFLADKVEITKEPGTFLLNLDGDVTQASKIEYSKVEVSHIEVF